MGTVGNREDIRTERNLEYIYVYIFQIYKFGKYIYYNLSMYDIIKQ